MRPGSDFHRRPGYGPPGPRGYGPPGFGGGGFDRGYGAPAPALPKFHVDREATCPLLLRVFVKQGQHHNVQEYKGSVPPEELQMYTWHDATLRELAELIQEVRADARGRVRLEFSFVYPDSRGRTVMKAVGTVHASGKGPDDLKTLHHLDFQTGDYLDVALLPL